MHAFYNTRQKRSFPQNITLLLRTLSDRRFCMDRWRPGDAFPPDGKAAGVKKGSVVLIPPAPDDPPKPLTDPKPEHCRTVYIGFLPRETNENHVYDAFNSCGRIEDIRLNTVKSFCHLQFYRSTAVDRALMYRGWWFKIGPSNTSNHVSKVVINYATSRPKEYLPFNRGILTTVSNQLKDKLQFDRASQQVKRWIEAGNCTPDLSASFFALLSSINGRAKQVIEGADKYEESMLAMMREAHEGTIESCELIDEVFQAAIKPGTLESFGRPQQNTITQWSQSLKEYVGQLQEKLQIYERQLASSELESQFPAAKKPKTLDDSDVYRDEVRRLKVDLEAARTRHAQELKAKNDYIKHLEKMSSEFREKYPAEWKATSESQIAVVFAEGGNSSGVNSDSGQTSDGDKVTLTQDEVSVATVLATFLAVHPLGASLGEIAEYAQAFNPKLDYVYVQSLLSRLPHVFQLSAQEGDDAKWWFLGFQSACHLFDGQGTARPEAQN